MSSNLKLNICLHNIVNDKSEIETIYDLTRSQLHELLSILIKLRSSGKIYSYELFFDDGYKSIINIAREFDFGINNSEVHGAIITDHIGLDNKLSAEDLKWLVKQGFSIDSHGVSHAALAIFQDQDLQTTKPGGIYHNKPYGKLSSLSEEEVKYQLIESGKKLKEVTGIYPSSFVLPYGLYNDIVASIATRFSSYTRLYTCHDAFDNGLFLAPRLLITQENINEAEDEILRLTDSYIPLGSQELD